MSEVDGSFQDIYAPDIVGSWKVKASWLGNPDYLGSTSFAAAFEVRDSSGSIPIELLAAAAVVVITVLALVAYWYAKKK
jgi:hypothetical protein